MVKLNINHNKCVSLQKLAKVYVSRNPAREKFYSPLKRVKMGSTFVPPNILRDVMTIPKKL
jgi:hypothetical protein